MTLVRSGALLDRLSGGLIPVGDGEVSPAVFGDALAWARAQRAPAVSFAHGVDRAAMGFDQIELITQAGEDAARLGVEHALVDLGGAMVRLDVPNRRVEAQIAAHGAVMERGIDAFVRPALGPADPEPVGGAGGDDGEAQEGAGGTRETPAVTRVLGGAPGPARVVRNASLVRTLAGSVLDGG